MGALNPFAMPVHPPLVHFPMALLTLVWVFVVFRYATGDVKWDRHARLFHLIGIGSLPFVLLSALVDTRGFSFITSPRWDAPLVWHALGGLLVAAAACGHFFWRRRYKAEEMTGRLAVQDVVWASIVMWVLVAVGLIAGEMVYAA